MRSGVFLANIVVFTRYCAETMVREFEGEIFTFTLLIRKGGNHRADIK